jgi:hypothetical protein
MRALQHAGAAGLGERVRAGLDAEQLLLEPARRQRRAVQRDEGPVARRERACSIRAATSLPAPAGPLISTREPVGATRSIAGELRTAAETPTSSVSAPARS